MSEEGAVVRSGRAPVDGAELYWELRGEGPPLLTIAGAGGDAGYFAAAGDALADEFATIGYDRRGNSRSGGRAEREISIAQQADDAAALIEQLADGSALVFGNSAGAIIAMELVKRHPERVAGVVVHEPPVIRILPDAARWTAFFDSIYEQSQREGIGPAAMRFQETIAGEGLVPKPPDVDERTLGNWEFFFRWELRGIVGYEPDEAALATHAARIVMAQGEGSRGRYYAETARILAGRCGTRWVELPGYHTPFMDDPKVFAAAIRPVLRELAVLGVPAGGRGAA